MRLNERNGAARLLEALRQADILDAADVRVLDLGHLPGLTSPSSIVRVRTRRRALAETDRALRSKIAGDADAPNGNDSDEAIVRPDALIARSTESMYRVGEIKSFAALRHLTDEQDVASAAAQSGVYAIALETDLRRLGSDLPIPTEVALVFRKPGGFNAEPTLQRIERDVETARRMLDQRPRSLREVRDILGTGALDTEANVLRLPPNFTGTCRSFCPMWQVCLNEARREGVPSVLGNDVEEAIGALGTIQRARELLAGAMPANDVEREIQRRLVAYQKELQEAVI
jgi:hypothetical protein